MKKQTPLFDLIDALSFGEIFLIIILILGILITFSLLVKAVFDNKREIEKLKKI